MATERQTQIKRVIVIILLVNFIFLSATIEKNDNTFIFNITVRPLLSAVFEAKFDAANLYEVQ